MSNKQNRSISLTAIVMAVFGLLWAILKMIEEITKISTAAIVVVIALIFFY